MDEVETGGVLGLENPSGKNFADQHGTYSPPKRPRRLRLNPGKNNVPFGPHHESPLPTYG
jgi:hypothetical protein